MWTNEIQHQERIKCHRWYTGRHRKDGPNKSFRKPLKINPWSTRDWEGRHLEPALYKITCLHLAPDREISNLPFRIHQKGCPIRHMITALYKISFLHMDPNERSPAYHWGSWKKDAQNISICCGIDALPTLENNRKSCHQAYGLILLTREERRWNSISHHVLATWSILIDRLDSDLTSAPTRKSCLKGAYESCNYLSRRMHCSKPWKHSNRPNSWAWKTSITGESPGNPAQQ